ncbi:hypothetical protein Lal_00022386 [Lupinus albus]|nr:hypothetical protein Lal_00022386 [Lupinus albus]
MTIIRDIVSDFSDEHEIELCGDDNKEDADVDIGSSELYGNITYATPSSFFTYTNSSADRDYRPRSTTFTNDNDLFVGIQFESKESTLDAIKQFHIRNSFDYIVVEKINGTHTCVSNVVSQDHTKLNSSFISNCIINLVSKDPDIPIKVIIVKEIVSRFRYTVTYRKTWIAKQLTMSQMYGDWEGSYNDLSRLMNVVQNFAGGTIVRYEVSRHFVVDIEDPTSFILDRVLWAFKPCIEGFAYCKPIIQVDGVHGYWLHFVLNCKNDLMLNQFIVFVILREFRDPDLKDKVIQMSYELMRPCFERMLSALHEKNPRARAWLDHIPKAKWAQCYDEERQYDHMTTNLAEAPLITAIVQTTYYRLNSWFVDHRDEVVNMIKAWHIYCEELTNVIKENQRQSKCQLVRSFSRETGVVEVEAPSRSGGRHSKVYTCDCGEFQSFRLSCSHAIVTCSNLNLDCLQFISPIYRLDNILKVYGLEF